mmetsp:Transcript_34334/g.60750  ORF Transcript_34334/g.60750 Transcript_34334/m.60750 type:complete len:82 (+) Transcript_34334:599-844(+)
MPASNWQQLATVVLTTITVNGAFNARIQFTYKCSATLSSSRESVTKHTQVAMLSCQFCPGSQTPVLVPLIVRKSPPLSWRG